MKPEIDKKKQAIYDLVEFDVSRKIAELLGEYTYEIGYLRTQINTLKQSSRFTRLRDMDGERLYEGDYVFIYNSEDLDDETGWKGVIHLQDGSFMIEDTPLFSVLFRCRRLKDENEKMRKSGIKGITWNKKSKKWRVCLKRHGVIIDGKREYTTLTAAKNELARVQEQINQIKKPRNPNMPEWFTKEWYEKKRKEGYYDYLLARQLHISDGTFYKWKKQLDVSKEFTRPRNVSPPEWLTLDWYKEKRLEGLTDTRIAKDHCAVSTTTFHKWKTKLGLPITTQVSKPEWLTKEWYDQQKQAGRMEVDIAKEIGCSTASLKNWRRNEFR